MTFKATILGVLGALFIACVGSITEQLWTWGKLTEGRLLPIVVFGLLTLSMMVVNPLLRRIVPAAAFRPREVAFIVALMLAGCSIPGAGMMRQFTQALAVPAQHNLTSPGWRKNRLLNYVPASMVPAEGKQDDLVTDGFVSGLGREGSPIALSDIPWAQWASPLKTWTPLILLSAICSICLALIVHRQWARRERLRYPIAELATSLLEQGEGCFGAIFRSKIFWIGFCTIVFIRVINGLNAWFPDTMIQIPLRLSFWPIAAKFTALQKTTWGGDLVFVYIVPVAIAFSFFLASDIALSLGLTQLVMVPISAFLLTAGIDISSGYMRGGATAWQRFGSFFAFALILLYVGRRYYWRVLRTALTFRADREVEPHSTWACRILLIGMGAMVAIIVNLGLEWPFAVLTVLLIMLVFLGTARIAAETGLFYVMPRWQPMGVLLGLLGAFAMGPKAIIIVGLLCVVLCIDPSESLMGYFINGLKVCDQSGVKPSRVAWASMGVYALGLGLAIPAVLWVNYNYGARKDLWSFTRVPAYTFQVANTAATELDTAGELEASVALGPIERLTRMKPKPMFLWAAGAGAALVLVVGALRLRYSWWPLHPVIFMVWATWPMVRLNHSFMIGWILKLLVTRLGGHTAYRKTKTLMIGVVAGELLCGLAFLVVALIYRAVTGLTPREYKIIPM